jgi:tyrosine-protein phosphatase
MRAAVSSDPAISSDIAALKGGGMHAAYAYAKEKSKWIGPNMS